MIRMARLIRQAALRGDPTMSQAEDSHVAAPGQPGFKQSSARCTSSIKPRRPVQYFGPANAHGQRPNLYPDPPSLLTKTILVQDIPRRYQRSATWARMICHRAGETRMRGGTPSVFYYDGLTSVAFLVTR
jgi:hypothetical protein